MQCDLMGFQLRDFSLIIGSNNNDNNKRKMFTAIYIHSAFDKR